MIFLDSSFLISLISDKSSKHNTACDLLDLVDKEYKLINSLVLSETLNGVYRCGKRKSLGDIYQILCETAEITFIKPQDYIEAINLSKYYGDSLNYSDCLILKTMQDKKINRIVSFDIDFDKINGIERIY